MLFRSFDFSVQMFFDSIQRFFSISEIATGMFKSAVFGGITALIGCHVGYMTEGGAEACCGEADANFNLVPHSSQYSEPSRLSVPQW